MLGVPTRRVDPQPESRGQLTVDDVVIEKWILTLEPGSKTPALLYRPAQSKGPAPAIVFTYGHGSSKSYWAYQYAGQLYAKCGLVALAIDPIGEEERHIKGVMGSRAHDNKTADERAAAAGRLIMGKLVFDTMRGVDFLMTRPDIDHAKIGVAGYSLGGAVATWMAALDTRLKTALVCGWAYDDIVLPTKLCQKVPFTNMRKTMEWPQFIGLAAPRCSILTANGSIDKVIDFGDRQVWSRSEANLKAARKYWPAASPANPQPLGTYIQPEGGHRPFFAYKESLLWIHDHLGTPRITREQIAALPIKNGGEWYKANGFPPDKLYGHQLHWFGSTLADMNIPGIRPADLACLKDSEKGSAEFTLEGWLSVIEKK